MKRTLLIVAAIFLGMTLLGTTCAFAKDEIQASIGGTWSAQGNWVGLGSWSETWTITQKGPIIKGSSNAGYTFRGFTFGSRVSFNINSGCFPKYKGKVTGNTMSGTMACTDGSGDTGTWSATKTSPALEEMEPEGDASAACPGEEE